MNDEHDLIEAAEAVIEDAYVAATVIEPQLRRFRRAFTDVGLPVPGDWATPNAEGGFDFGSLTAKQLDRLICLLEDIAENRPIEVTIMRGGPTLFDPGAPAGPSVAPRTSSVHVVVPQ